MGLPFISKPDRMLYKDYYVIIEHPVSLRSISKRVRGIEGRKPHRLTTAFPTWDSFETEMEFMWSNARKYNEDTSDIVAFAKILESYFQRRVAEARKIVKDEQVATDEVNTRIKLRIRPNKTPEAPTQRLTLRFPSQKIAEARSTDREEQLKTEPVAKTMTQAVSSAPVKDADTDVSEEKATTTTEKIPVTGAAATTTANIQPALGETSVMSVATKPAPDVGSDATAAAKTVQQDQQEKHSTITPSVWRDPKGMTRID